MEALALLREQLAQESIDALRRRARYSDPLHLIPFGCKVYSQNDEDGIINEIFNRIGVTNRVFVEFGIGDGLENNTLALMFSGWRGLWIEANADGARTLAAKLPRTLASGRLKVTNALVTRENIDELISGAVKETEIDLLSIDIDGNDYHVFEAITCCSARVVVIEYNAKFAPPIRYCMEYDPAHTWAEDDCFGASLKFLEIAFASKGYKLVACNLTGSNAFFVRDDMVGDRFLAPYSAEHHFEPARYYLAGVSSGQKPSFRTLETSSSGQP